MGRQWRWDVWGGSRPRRVSVGAGPDVRGTQRQPRGPCEWQSGWHDGGWSGRLARPLPVQTGTRFLEGRIEAEEEKRGREREVNKEERNWEELHRSGGLR